MRDLNLIKEIIMLESDKSAEIEQRDLKRIVREFGATRRVRMVYEKFQRTNFKPGSAEYNQQVEELFRLFVEMLLELVDRAKNASRSFIDKIKNVEFRKVFRDKLIEGVRSVIEGIKSLQKMTFGEIIASMGSVLSQAWTFACKYTNYSQNYSESTDYKDNEDYNEASIILTEEHDLDMLGDLTVEDEVTKTMHPNAAPAQPDEQGILALAKSTRPDVQGILALAEQHGITLETKAASAVRRLYMAHRNAYLGTDSTNEKQLQVIRQLQEIQKDLPDGTTLGEIKQISKVPDQAALLAIEDAERPNAPGPEINRVRIAVDANEAATKIQGFARMVAAKSAVGERRKEAKEAASKLQKEVAKIEANEEARQNSAVNDPQEGRVRRRVTGYDKRVQAILDKQKRKGKREKDPKKDPVAIVKDLGKKEKEKKKKHTANPSSPSTRTNTSGRM